MNCYDRVFEIVLVFLSLAICKYFRLDKALEAPAIHDKVSWKKDKGNPLLLFRKILSVSDDFLIRKIAKINWDLNTETIIIILATLRITVQFSNFFSSQFFLCFSFAYKSKEEKDYDKSIMNFLNTTLFHVI